MTTLQWIFIGGTANLCQSIFRFETYLIHMWHLCRVLVHEFDPDYEFEELPLGWQQDVADRVFEYKELRYDWIIGLGDFPLYNWDAWNDDHFQKFGFEYEPMMYDWEKWVADLFSPGTSFGE